MFSNRKADPMNASALAVNTWIQEVEETHLQIQRELEKIRYTIRGESQARAMDQIMACLRKLHAVSPTPRMVNVWLTADSTPRWN